MMINVTDEISSTNSLIRQWLLGDSIKSILIRLTVIVSAIVAVWSGIMFALIIHMKWQRAKQILKTSNTHHHLYDSNTSLNKRRSHCSKPNPRFHSSLTSLSSKRCYSIRHLLTQLKQHCTFWPLFRVNGNLVHRSSSMTKRKTQIETLTKTSNSSPAKVQLVVESMNRRSFIAAHHNNFHIGKKISLYRQGDYSSGDQLKNLYSTQNELQYPIESNQSTSTTIQLIEPESCVQHPFVSLSVNETKDEHSTTKRFHQFNTKAALFFYPITRRLSTANTNSSLPPTNSIEKQQKTKPLLMISSARELTSTNDWQWQHSLVDEATITDGSRTSSTRHIPLVMITDTSSSNTNILELETFEDRHRLIGDVERRLSRELRASYRPRHST